MESEKELLKKIDDKETLLIFQVKLAIGLLNDAIGYINEKDTDSAIHCIEMVKSEMAAYTFLPDPKGSEHGIPPHDMEIEGLEHASEFDDL